MRKKQHLAFSWGEFGGGVGYGWEGWGGSNVDIAGLCRDFHARLTEPERWPLQCRRRTGPSGLACGRARWSEPSVLQGSWWLRCELPGHRKMVQAQDSEVKPWLHYWLRLWRTCMSHLYCDPPLILLTIGRFRLDHVSDLAAGALQGLLEDRSSVKNIEK